MNTTIIAIRHAKPLNTGFADELLRPLSKEGIATQKEVVEKLKKKGYRPNLILCSPILRAVQTAEIISKIFSIDIIETNALGYDFDAEQLLAFFPLPEQNQTIILVGHAPMLAEFVNEMTGKKALPFGLSKSSAAVFAFNHKIQPGSAEFREYIQP